MQSQTAAFTFFVCFRLFLLVFLGGGEGGGLGKDFGIVFPDINFV